MCGNPGKDAVRKRNRGFVISFLEISPIKSRAHSLPSPKHTVFSTWVLSGWLCGQARTLVQLCDRFVHTVNHLTTLGTSFLLYEGLQKGMLPCPHLDFSPVRPVLDF